MAQNDDLSGPELETLLAQAKEGCAHASIRAVGSSRMLGDLQVRGLEPGKAVQLMGVKRREQFPSSGTEVTLSILIGDEVISSRTVLLDPIIYSEGDTLFPPVLRVAWPARAVQSHRRRDVRVASPDLPPLSATLEFGGRKFQADLLNLAETGMGLGFSEEFPIALKDVVEVETRLPRGRIIRTTGEVRYAETVAGEPLPFRVGLVLGTMADHVQDTLHRFIQARRMDRSEGMRRLR